MPKTPASILNAAQARLDRLGLATTSESDLVVFLQEIALLRAVDPEGNTTTPRDVTTSGTIAAGAKTLYFKAITGTFTITGNGSSVVFQEGEYLNLEYPGPGGHGEFSYSTTGILRIVETR